MHSVGIRAFSAFISLTEIQAPSISLHNEKEKETVKARPPLCHVLQFHQCPMFISASHLCASLSCAVIWPLTSALLWHPCPSSSILSHKDSVSPVGGGAREDLCHAWPHHAGERHQGSDHAVRPGWPRAGGHHRLGQAHPRYKTNDFCFLFVFFKALFSHFYFYLLSFSVVCLSYALCTNKHAHSRT